MKKTNSLVLFFLICSLASQSQITITGVPLGGKLHSLTGCCGGDPSTWGDFNATYNDVSNNLSYYPSTGYQYQYAYVDANTKVFESNGSNYFIMLRQNNKWQLHQIGPYNNVRFESKASYNDSKPPCTAVYNEYQDWEMWFTQNFAAPKIKIGEFTITMTGDCSTAPPLPTTVSAITMTPTSLTLPQLTNTMINNLPSPSPGSMVWSVDDNCIKVYNGTAWNCL